MSIYRICAECGKSDGGWTGLCWSCKRMYVNECDECGRVFNMNDETDAAEWTHGHDCEEPSKCIDCGDVAKPGESYCGPCDAPIFGSPPYAKRIIRTFRESSEKA